MFGTGSTNLILWYIFQPLPEHCFTCAFPAIDTRSMYVFKLEFNPLYQEFQIFQQEITSLFTASLLALTDSRRNDESQKSIVDLQTLRLDGKGYEVNSGATVYLKNGTTNSIFKIQNRIQTRQETWLG